MDENLFWWLIDTHFHYKIGGLMEPCEHLIKTLIQYETDEILDFYRIFQIFDIEAYDAALWDAAYIIGCGCSDDGFYDVRSV